MVMGGKLIMNYQNLIPQKGIDSKKTTRHILYVTVIGKDADTAVNEMFAKLYLKQPRVRKSKLGTLNVTKYSFELSDESVVTNTANSLKSVWINNHKDECRLKKKKKNSVYVINNIEFY